MFKTSHDPPWLGEQGQATRVRKSARAWQGEATGRLDPGDKGRRRMLVWCYIITLEIVFYAYNAFARYIIYF